MVCWGVFSSEITSLSVDSMPLSIGRARTGSELPGQALGNPHRKVKPLSRRQARGRATRAGNHHHLRNISRRRICRRRFRPRRDRRRLFLLLLIIIIIHRRRRRHRRRRSLHHEAQGFAHTLFST